MDDVDEEVQTMDYIMGLNREELIIYLIETFGDVFDPEKIRGMSDDAVQQFKCGVLTGFTSGSDNPSSINYCDNNNAVQNEDDDDDVIFLQVVVKNPYTFQQQQQQSNSTSHDDDEPSAFVSVQNNNLSHFSMCDNSTNELEECINSPVNVDNSQSPSSSPESSELCVSSTSVPATVPYDEKNNLIVIDSSPSVVEEAEEEEEEQQQQQKIVEADDDGSNHQQLTKDHEPSIVTEKVSSSNSFYQCKNLKSSSKHDDDKSLEQQIEESPQYNMTQSSILKPVVVDNTKKTTTTSLSLILSSRQNSSTIPLSPITATSSITTETTNEELELIRTSPTLKDNDGDGDHLSDISSGELEEGEIPDSVDPPHFSITHNNAQWTTEKNQDEFSSSSISTITTWDREREKEILEFFQRIETDFPVSIYFNFRSIKVMDRGKAKYNVNIFFQISSTSLSINDVRRVTSIVQTWIVNIDNRNASTSSKYEDTLSMTSADWEQFVIQQTDSEGGWEYNLLATLKEMMERFETKVFLTKYEQNDMVHLELSSGSQENLKEAKSRLRRYFRFIRPPPSTLKTPRRISRRRSDPPSRSSSPVMSPPVTSSDVKKRKKSHHHHHKEKRRRHRHSSSSTSKTTSATVFYIPKIFDELPEKRFRKFLKNLQQEFRNSKISHDVEDMDRIKKLVKISIKITSDPKTTPRVKQKVLHWIKKQESAEQCELRENEESGQQQPYENSLTNIMASPSQTSSTNLASQPAVSMDSQSNCSPPLCQIQQGSRSPENNSDGKNKFFANTDSTEVIIVSPEIEESPKEEIPKIVDKLKTKIGSNNLSPSVPTSPSSASAQNFSFDYTVHFGDWFIESQRITLTPEGSVKGVKGQSQLIKVLHDLVSPDGVKLTSGTPSPTTCHMPLLLHSDSEFSLSQANTKLDNYFRATTQHRMDTTKSLNYYNSLVTIATAIDPQKGSSRSNRWIKQFCIDSMDWKKLCIIFCGPERLMSRLGSLVTDYVVSLEEKMTKVEDHVKEDSRHLIILKGQVKECVDDASRVIYSILHLFRIPCVSSKIGDSLSKSEGHSHHHRHQSSKNLKKMSALTSVFWIEKDSWDSALSGCTGDRNRLFRRLQLLVRELGVKIIPGTKNEGERDGDEICISVHGGPSKNNKEVHQSAVQRLEKFFNASETTRNLLLWGAQKILTDKKNHTNTTKR